MAEVTREDLIDEFQRLADALGETPTLQEFNDEGKYSSTPVYDRFDSYNALKQAAGHSANQFRIEEETLIDDLLRVANDIGRTPPVMVYDERGHHNSKTLKRRFGNWNEVLREAGLEPTNHSEHWADNEPNQFTEDYRNIPVTCANCSNTVYRKPHEIRTTEKFFCDPDCKGEFMSSQTGDESRVFEGGKVKVSCERCGEPSKVYPAKVESSRFCSQDCMIAWRSEHFSGENNPRWKDEADVERYYGPSWRMQRRRARERDNHQCQRCGMGREEHNSRWGCDHSVHHIKPFFEFEDYTEANRLDNLVTLCKVCHGLVDSGVASI